MPVPLKFAVDATHAPFAHGAPAPSFPSGPQVWRLPVESQLEIPFAAQNGSAQIAVVPVVAQNCVGVHAVTAAAQFPEASQVWMPLLVGEQRIAPGLHALAHTALPPQAPLPVGLHVCGLAQPVAT